MSRAKSRNSKLATQVGARIHVLRMERGFSVRKLAEMAECSIQSICNVESGIHGGSTTTLRKIARALKVELFDLFNVDTQTDDLGYVVEKMRHDPSVLRLVLTKLDRSQLPPVLRSGSSAPASC